MNEVSETLPRRLSHIGEFDRVLGGGLVQGSVILIGGDPGIGKSTLLLQVTSALASADCRCAYISGEESLDQIRLRAKRLGLSESKVDLAAETNVNKIVATLDDNNPYDVVVIDSIQTMFIEQIDSSPGTVSQVRAAGNELIKIAKKRNFVLFLVGHVTKEGALAGPRVLEHMVDTVLYFEGDRGHHFRILRGVKNRFGATDEIGVFAMRENGLEEILNPSALFLAERRGNITGSAVFAGIEGTRPILVEIQALVAPASAPNSRRAVVGYDANRLSMLIAILETRCGVSFQGKDVYVNVAGGIKIGEVAADMAVASALLSSISDVPTPPDTVFFGEIGLSGEIRAVPLTEQRIKESSKLGFKRAVMPRIKTVKKDTENKPFGINIKEIGNLIVLKELFIRD